MFCVLRFVLSFLRFGALRIFVCLQLCTFFLQHFKGFATAVAKTTTTTTLSIHCYYLLWPKSNTYLTRAVEDECTFVYKYVYFTRLPFHFLSLRSQSDQLIIPYTKHNTHTQAHTCTCELHMHMCMYTCTQKQLKYRAGKSRVNASFNFYLLKNNLLINNFWLHSKYNFISFCTFLHLSSYLFNICCISQACS